MTPKEAHAALATQAANLHDTFSDTYYAELSEDADALADLHDTLTKMGHLLFELEGE